MPLIVRRNSIAYRIWDLTFFDREYLDQDLHEAGVTVLEFWARIISLTVPGTIFVASAFVVGIVIESPVSLLIAATALFLLGTNPEVIALAFSACIAVFLIGIIFLVPLFGGVGYAIRLLSSWAPRLHFVD